MAIRSDNAITVAMEKYIVLEKAVGETPLSCAEKWRLQNPDYVGIPLAYAGRLDPMASGKLLVLIGEECKNQTNYHGLDKEYEFSVLLGIGSDTHDVLGRLKTHSTETNFSNSEISKVIESLAGKIKFPYPKFSAKTVQGKPLHMWTLENRLHEIEIPTKESEIFSLEVTKIETITRQNLVEQALEKVNSVPPVTELRKALGNDFRRVDVRRDWEEIKNNSELPEHYQIIYLRCIASSGTYMRSLAEIIGTKLGTYGLAWHIHRTQIGVYDSIRNDWSQKF